MSPDLARAEALIDLHRPDEAVRLATSAMASSPEDPRPHLVAARAHLAADRPEDCFREAQTALRLDPESGWAARLMALAMGSTGDLHAARYWADQAVALTSWEPYAHAVRAQILALSGKKSDALAAAEHAVELNPDNAYGHFVMGTVLYSDGRYRASEDALRHSLTLDPTDAQTLAALGETLAARGRRSDAAELLQLAARADVRDETIHQDMLRYVRSAMWGLATWPVILGLVLFGLVGTFSDPATPTTDRVITALVFGVSALVLFAGRERRLRRFPREVRRLLNERATTRAAFESAGPAGWRPWWWRLLVRIPLSVRALACWLLWLGFWSEPLSGDFHWTTGDWIAVGVYGAIPVYLTIRMLRAHRRARAPHRFYDPTIGAR